MKHLLASILALATLSATSQQLPFTSDLYMIGGATPNGWDNTAGVHLTTAPGESDVLTWIGTLNSGDFKFILTPGTWMPAYNALQSDQPITLGVTYPMVKNLNYEVEDHKFMLTKSGLYKVTVNLADKSNPTLTVTDAPTVDIAGVTAHGTAIPEGSASLSKQNSYTYIYEGELRKGNLWFSLPSGEWIVPVLADIDILDQGFFVTTNDNEPIRRWNVAVAQRRCRITLDFLNQTVTIESVTPPTALYMVGGATKIGWNAEAAIEMPADVDNSWKFTFHGVLRNRTDNVEPTSFKILAQLDWGPTSYHPVSDLQNILEATSFVENGDDSKWTIDPSQQGYYTIALDLEHNTLSASFDQVYTGEEYADNLYMIGGATEAGWILENAIPMVRDEANPALFTFTGDLRYRGENEDPRQFKILGQRSWDPYSLHSTVQDEDPLSATVVVEGGDDNKWSVQPDKEGTYTITVNLANLSISAYSHDNTTPTNDEAGAAPLTACNVKISACAGCIQVTTGEKPLDASLVTLQGRILSFIHGSGTLVLGENLPSGIYFVVTSEGTRKIWL
ncbi:MAG: SusF/SusE family outer membrane protein [Bacteroidales bacterium]|nr:SusF/SusE family outer membrane protein [Bacteroidales bacterium]